MTHPRIAVGARVRVLNAKFVDLSDDTFGTVTSNTETFKIDGKVHHYKVDLEPGLASKSNAGAEIYALGLEVVPTPEPKRVLLPRPTVRERDGLLAEIAALELGLKVAIDKLDEWTDWADKKRVRDDQDQRREFEKLRAAENLADVLKLQLAEHEASLAETRTVLDRHKALRAYVEGHLLDETGLDRVNGFTHGYVAGRDA